MQWFSSSLAQTDKYAIPRLLLFILLPAALLPAAAFRDSFADGSTIASYRFWVPSGQPGKVAFAPETGHAKPGSACISGTMRAGFTATMPIRDGDAGLYRFSAWVRSEETGMGTMRLHCWPALQGRGEVPALGATTLAMPLNPQWSRLELYFRVPAGRRLAGTTITALSAQAILSNFSGKVFLDDIAIEKADAPYVWSEDFTDAGAVWGLHGFNGIEGVTAVARVPEGCGDPGAIAVTWKSGKSGYGAAPKTPLPASRFAATRHWALELSVLQTSGASAILAVEQYDARGKLLETTSGTPVPGSPGYRMAALPFAIHPEAAALRPAVINAGKGTVTFDHAAIRLADAAETIMLARQRKAPLWSILYPADFFAHIDRHTPIVKLLAGRTNFVLAMLAGDKSLDGDTHVDLTLPDSVELLAAQFSTYGPAYKVLPLPATTPGTHRHRIVNPYDWKRYMMRNNPNHYSGLELVLRAKGAPGRQPPLQIELSVGKTTGESREVPIEILPPAPVARPMNWFTVGCWGFNHAHVLHPDAHRAILSSMVASGITHGTVHASQPYAAARAVPLGFQPGVIVHSPDLAALYGKHDFPRRTLADGRLDKAHVALGAVLDDPELRRLYRAYLASCLKLLPPAGIAFANLDIEFWGTGVSTQSCFHPATIDAFRRYARLAPGLPLDAKTILDKHRQQWYAFRNDVTVRMHRMVRDLLHELRPGTILRAYDYTLQLDGTPAANYRTLVPTDSLAYDRANAIDAHLVSYYSIEGVHFLDHVDCDARTFRKPVYAVPYLTEALPGVQMPTWSYHHPGVPEVRLEVLAAAASGAAGITYFTGMAIDGERLNAINEGLNAVAKFEEFYRDGQRDDASVHLQGLTPEMRYRVHRLGTRGLLTVFNCGRVPARITLPGGAILAIPPMDFLQREL